VKLFEKPAKPKDPAVISENRRCRPATAKNRPRVCAKSTSESEDGQKPARNIRFRAASTSTFRKANTSKAGRSSHRRPGQPARFAGRSLGEKIHAGLSRQRPFKRSTASRASTINDKHIETIVRQMMRLGSKSKTWATQLPARGTNRQVPLPAREKRSHHQRRQPPRNGPVRFFPWYHQGFALDRFVHLRRQLSGDDSRPHRSGCRRQGGLSPRPQGKNGHHGAVSSRPVRASSHYRSLQVADGGAPLHLRSKTSRKPPSLPQKKRPLLDLHGKRRRRSHRSRRRRRIGSVATPVLPCKGLRSSIGAPGGHGLQRSCRAGFFIPEAQFEGPKPAL